MNATGWDELDGTSTDEENEELANFCFMAYEQMSVQVCLKTNSTRKKWFLDNGCSRHMTGDADKFLSLSYKKEGLVTFGDNAKGRIIGKDSLEEKPCISVEIKIYSSCSSLFYSLHFNSFFQMQPKCGFIPNSRFITEGNSVKRSISRFRMHQFLKLHQNEVSQVSEYDPLDLFSGCKDRIHKAIKALFAHPQNNLRVFLNGSLVFGSLAGSTGSTIFVNGEAFENALKHAIWAEDGLRTMSFVHLVAETVFKSRVLDLLLKVQHRDNLDIEGAIHAYYDVVSQPCIVCRDLGEDQTSGKYAILHSIPLDESFNIVRDYLIAATAKDCSLIISFRPRENGKQGSPYCDVHLESTNQNFDYKAYFIDLDMKPLKKMEYYYELDQKILSCYTQMPRTEHKPENAASIETHRPIYRELIQLLKRYLSD
ncbi:inositol-pentakisphosphate 2-kinase-like isoform X3 [Malania oleifera]|uniref:inositol-pentakisphosphate 2-kinase-like isoform X3 n=1 Tax=Malania oleifera TaxID=397392 RepID=UPI0025ADB4F4|nr:inositol-pentakisphosphate 2-kinase-like isoform X3 [Malania oleifera]